MNEPSWAKLLRPLRLFAFKTEKLKIHILLPIVVAITMFVWQMPIEWFGIEGLTIIQQRTIAIFVFAALSWLLELIPSWTTSVVTIVLLLFLTSNKGVGLTTVEGIDGLKTIVEGTPVDYKQLMASFADPIIMLFLGGFVLAAAATKVGLDIKLARTLLKPFGKKPQMVLLGFLLVIGVFSMFMSNTATAAMMLAILAPVLKELPADGKGRIGLSLSIPIAANIGGIGTPIGTPPNAIAMGALNNLGLEISFGAWMLRMVPLVIVLLLFAWGLLLVMFPFKAKEINLQIKEAGKSNWKNYVVYATYAITILLWMTESWTHINSNIVALLPFAIFAATGIFTKKDLSEINWSVLWMVAGGIALGTAMNKTGLAAVMVHSIPFESWSPLGVMIAAMVIGYILSNFISHSAAANLLVPILSTVGFAMKDTLATYGGVKALLVGLALATSVAMILPISTPPNAIASSTGMIETKDMAKTGIIMGIVGLLCGFAVITLIGI